jgi:hypothetical protein
MKKPHSQPLPRKDARRRSALKLTAFAFAAALALLSLTALPARTPSSAAPPDPVGAITARAGNYIGPTTTETFTLEKQIFTGSTDCTSGGGPVVTVTGVNQATGHAIPLAPTDSVLLTVPVSPVGGGAFSDRVSEQNGPFVQWNPDASSMTLASYPPGTGHICARGPSDADPHDFIANFYAGIELFDSCGSERYLYRPGEAVTVRVTGGVTFLAEQPRLQAGGGGPNECGFPPFDTTTINTNTDPFNYTLTLPASDADIPAYCASNNTTHITGDWRVVTYDVPGCGCNRNTMYFKVQEDAPAPSCPLDCPGDIEQTAAANACGANVNFTPPTGAPGETINCDHASGSFFPVGTTEVKCTSSLGRECGFDVKVNDTTTPAVTPPANIEVGTDAGVCEASVNPGTATASDGCAVSVAGVRGDAQPLNAPYPKGTTTITWMATDASGNTATAAQTVKVVDDEAPAVSAVSASPSVLWPPNHSMRDVALSYTATDNCGGPVNCTVTSVTSSEPANGTGDGDTAPDFEIVGPTLVRLRAERSGNGPGRVYNVTVMCTDGTNASSGGATVTVPKSQKK